MSQTNIPELGFEVTSNLVAGINLEVIGADYQQYPLRVCVPVPRGCYFSQHHLHLADENGNRYQSSIKPLLLWHDGSVRVYEIWLPLTLPKTGQKAYRLVESANSEDGASVGTALSLLTTPAAVRMEVEIAGGPVLQQTVGLPAPQPGPAPYRLADEAFSYSLNYEGEEWFRGTLERRTWEGYPGVDFACRLICCKPGEITSVKSVTLSFEVPLVGTPNYWVRQLFHGEMPHPRLVRSTLPLPVQADAGAVRVLDVDLLQENPESYPPYERPGIQVVEPWSAVTDAEQTWLLLFPEAMERHPKAWLIDGNRVQLEMHPAAAPPLAWRRGMALFGRFQLLHFSGEATEAELENAARSWLRPPLAQVPAESYRAAGWRIPFRYQPERYPRTEINFRRDFSFNWARGTFDWGDEICGSLTDRVASLTAEQRAAAVWRNHEYDVVAACAREYARTTRGQLLRLCRNAAEHLMHTDFVAVSDDPWREGGVPAHCAGHTSGAAYPSHIWTEGLMLYYQLSGDKYALEVGCRIGDFLLRYLEHRPGVYCGTAREGGWALIALAALYDVTAAPRFLDGLRRIAEMYLELRPENFFPYDASFTVGIAVIGLDRAAAWLPDKDIKSHIIEVLNWQMAHRLGPEGLFDYHVDSERAGTHYVQSKLPEALNTGYRLTGEVKYLRAAWRLYQAAQHTPLTVQTPGLYDASTAAANQLSWHGCLASFAELGWLDAMQYLEPSTGP